MRLATWFLAATAALVLAAGASAAPLVTGDLLLYYDFDEIGTTVADGSGHGYDGTVVRDVTSVTGVRGGAAKFGPAVDNPNSSKDYTNYVDIPVADIPQEQIPSTDFTLAVWVNSAATTADQAIFCPLGKDPTSSSINEYVTGSPTETITWQMHIQMQKQSDSWYRFLLRTSGMIDIGELKYKRTDPVRPVYGEWHHLAFTFSKSTGQMAIWVNGEKLDAEYDSLGNLTQMASYKSVDFNYAIYNVWDWARVGCNVDDIRQFTGSMDEFYIFSRVLTADEIGDLYNVPEEYHPGDANKDGKVDDLDASILAANWQRTGDATWDTADFNADGDVDDLDASILAANWQYGVGAAVPEPSTLALLAGGLALLVLARRRG